LKQAKPYVLSIAGFDPSGGAGILADVKTIEANGGYGLGVLTANTFQNDIAFEKAEWITADKIKAQIEVLLKRFNVNYFKIGLIENMRTLERVVSFIKEHNPNASIIWDPILKASAGFQFHSSIDRDHLQSMMKKIRCITPNIPEAMVLFENQKDLHDKLLAESMHCAIYLKDGHGKGTVATDKLYIKHTAFSYLKPRIDNAKKHGSGCVLSASLATQLALGYDLQTAGEYANSYTRQFLASNETLLGYHQYSFSYETDQ
jgi:hydroxymethylpyrimidine/phosphomethylpyrimidine kinase